MQLIFFLNTNRALKISSLVSPSYFQIEQEADVTPPGTEAKWKLNQ